MTDSLTLGFGTGCMGSASGSKCSGYLSLNVLE